MQFNTARPAMMARPGLSSFWNRQVSNQPKQLSPLTQPAAGFVQGNPGINPAHVQMVPDPAEEALQWRQHFLSNLGLDISRISVPIRNYAKLFEDIFTVLPKDWLMVQRGAPAHLSDNPMARAALSKGLFTALLQRNPALAAVMLDLGAEFLKKDLLPMRPQDYALIQHVLNAGKFERPREPLSIAPADIPQLNLQMLRIMLGGPEEDTALPGLREAIQHLGIRFSPQHVAGMNLSSARLNGVTMNGAVFQRVNLDEADLVDAKLRRCVFDQVYCPKADFTHADLQNAKFLHSNAEGASFRSANLESAEFKRTNVAHADFSGAMLKGIRT